MSTNRAFAVVIAIAILAGGCASARKAAENRRLQARNSYEQALNYVNGGQVALALSALQQAISLDPKVAVYHDTLGRLYLEIRQLEQAVAALTKAADLDRERGDTFFYLGTALAESRRWDDAVAAYRRGLSLPTLTLADSAHQNLGLALFHLKRYREAEEALRFALNMDPRMQAAYYNLGLVLAAQNRPDEAKASFRAARQLGPDNSFGQAALEHLKAMGDGG